MWETQVRSLGREDPLEKEMATHSSNPLQNPMEGGARWATVHGVAKSRTRLSNFTFTFMQPWRLCVRGLAPLLYTVIYYCVFLVDSLELSIYKIISFIIEIVSHFPFQSGCLAFNFLA